jgi:hypothetical protein
MRFNLLAFRARRSMIFPRWVDNFNTGKYGFPVVFSNGGNRELFGLARTGRGVRAGHSERAEHALGQLPPAASEGPPLSVLEPVSAAVPGHAEQEDDEHQHGPVVPAEDVPHGREPTGRRSDFLRPAQAFVHYPDGWRRDDTGFLHRLAEVVAGEELVRPVVVVDLEDQDDVARIRSVAINAVVFYSVALADGGVPIVVRLPGIEIFDRVAYDGTGYLSSTALDYETPLERRSGLKRA